MTIADEDEFRKFKTLIKKTKDKIFSRKVNTKRLEQIKVKIDSLERDVEIIVEQEKIEREIRLAEVEADKAQNMLTYRDEIYSRPRREWFMSKSKKKKIREE